MTVPQKNLESTVEHPCTAAKSITDGRRPVDLIRQFCRRLSQPEDPLPLVWLRISYGLTLLYWSVKYLSTGLMFDYYVQPRFHFKYDGFGWVQLDPETAFPVFLVIAVSAVLVTVGLCYRVSSLLLGFCFAWVFLSDKTYYQNHYYLLTLVGLLLPWLPCHQMWSFDRLLFRSVRRLPTRYWMVFQIRWYIGIPYFFGGVAKITADWLAGQPMRMVLAGKSWHPVFGAFVHEEWFVMAFVWTGLLFDLFIVPALWWKPTRIPALCAALAFHLLNATTFQIGVFPWFMIAVTPLLLPATVLRSWLKQPAWQPVNVNIGRWKKCLVGTFCLVTVVVHCVLPFRHHVMLGNVNWNELGHHFSWRMKLRGKTSAIYFDIYDAASGAREAGQPNRWLTAFQTNRMARDPHLVHQFSRFLRQQYVAQGYPETEVRVLLLVSLNGRKPQIMIDPKVDLGKLSLTESPEVYVRPLKEPLLFEGWTQDRRQWQKLIPSAIGAQ